MKITRISKSSWFKIATKDKIIHFDPGYMGYFQNQGIPEQEFEEKADLVLISHFHKDHLQPEVLPKFTDNHTVIIAPLNCKERISREIIVAKPDEELEIEGISIKTVQAYNTISGKSTIKAHHYGEGLGFIINLEDVTIYHAGDTDVIPEMSLLGKIDIALLPIGGTYVMNNDEAIEATRIIQPKILIPMHHANSDMAAFKRKVEAELKNVQCEILNCGDQYSY